MEIKIGSVAAVCDHRKISRRSSAVIDRRYRETFRHAFTLIELLVVIVIIAVLMGIAFPVFSSIQNQAKKTQAKNDLTQIVTAVNAFYTEYGKYPIVTGDTPIANTTDLFYALRAVASGQNAADAINPRKVTFLNVPDVKDQTSPRSGIKTSDGQWYDPWGSTYKVAIDGTYDNQLANPYGPAGGAGSDPLRQGVIVWSLGKNSALGGGPPVTSKFDKEFGSAGNYTGSGDVISWQ